MKKNKLKYVVIPTLAAATLFPVLADDNQAKANDDKVVTSSNVSKPEGTNDKSASVSKPNNVNDKIPTPVDNTESTNSANVVNNEIVASKVPFTVAEYKQKSALELAQLIREKKVTSTELVNLAYKKS